jgi:hypothetical protein
MVAGFYISTKKADAEFDSDAWLSARPNERGVPEAIRVDPSTISFYFLLQFVPNRFGQMQQRAAVIALVESGQHFLAQTIRLFVGNQRFQGPAHRDAILPIGIGEQK